MTRRQSGLSVNKQNGAAFFDRCDAKKQSKRGHDPKKQVLVHFIKTLSQKSWDRK